MALGRHMRPTLGKRCVSTGLWHSGHAGESVRAGLGMSRTGASALVPDSRTPTPQRRRQSTIGWTGPASSGSKRVMIALQNTGQL
jgi:hypothetical protein